MSTKTHTVYSREQHEVNTDPQRRCYYGVHAKSEWRWSEWHALYDVAGGEEAQERVASWQALAKQSRRRLEYKALPIGEKP